MDLSAQLNHLDRLLLSTVITAFPDPLTDEEKAATNAYVLLAHAVLEEHLEDAFEMHYARLKGWLVSSMVPLETARLVFAMAYRMPKDHRVPYKKQSLAGMATSDRATFRTEVRGNHGIKSDNLAKLAGLVGLDWKEFDDALNSELADLDTLGSKRGEAGHLSPYTEKAVHITRQIYPEEVRDWVAAARDASVAVCAYLDGLVTNQQPLSLIADRDGN